MSPPDFRPARPEDFAAIQTLLADEGLPYEDVTVGWAGRFHVAFEREKLCGCVGLELYDADALLRSVVVAKGARSRRLGRALVDIAERDAATLGVSRLFLLTTSATHYFAMLGYQPFERDAAPNSLQSSSQFSALCPTSAVCMVKDLTQQEA